MSDVFSDVALLLLTTLGVALPKSSLKLVPYVMTLSSVTDNVSAMNETFDVAANNSAL
jgi:hypothetical protein